MSDNGDSDSFDLIVVGAGPGGEVVASRLGDSDLRIALVERELIGGECAYWACMPSKTLLRPPEVLAEARRVPGVREPGTAWSEIARYRDYMIRDLDDAAQERAYEDQGIAVVRGAGRLAGPG